MGSVTRIKADILDWREVEGEIVAVHRKSGVYLAINGSGTVLWERLLAGTTRAELEEIIVETYAIPAHAAGRDVAEFLDELSSQGLLEDLEAEPR